MIAELDLIAHRLGIEPKEMHKRELKKAIKAYDNQNKTYWNALANSGQLHDNVPRTMMITLCYLFLIGEL